MVATIALHLFKMASKKTKYDAAGAGIAGVSRSGNTAQMSSSRPFQVQHYCLFFLVLFS